MVRAESIHFLLEAPPSWAHLLWQIKHGKLQHIANQRQDLRTPHPPIEVFI